MSLESLLREAVESLREREILFAVAGGLAADLYRCKSRLTMDVDLAIVTEKSALKPAVSVIESMGLEAVVVRKADLVDGPLFAIRRGNTTPCMVVGRKKCIVAGEWIDLLLPAIPWVGDAVRRAQDNGVDFGFGAIPVLTVEDVILSKLYVLNSARLRAKDLDDLQSIYESECDIDLAYLSGQMRRFDIRIPRAAEPFLDDVILKVSRDIVRAARVRRKGA